MTGKEMLLERVSKTSEELVIVFEGNQLGDSKLMSKLSNRSKLACAITNKSIYTLDRNTISKGYTVEKFALTALDYAKIDKDISGYKLQLSMYQNVVFNMGQIKEADAKVLEDFIFNKANFIEKVLTYGQD